MSNQEANQDELKVIRCPVHGIPDCSPLLNGCSRVIKLMREQEERTSTT